MAEAEQVREELRAAPDSLAIVKVLRAHGLGNLDVLAIGAEELARRAAPVGGAGVRLTPEEADAVIRRLEEEGLHTDEESTGMRGYRADCPACRAIRKLRPLTTGAASVGEGDE